MLFYSMVPDGRLDERSLHGGCKPRREGAEKWGANQWIWNHPQRRTHAGVAPRRLSSTAKARQRAAASSGCVDEEDNCEEWARLGECAKVQPASALAIGARLSSPEAVRALPPDSGHVGAMQRLARARALVSRFACAECGLHGAVVPALVWEVLVPARRQLWPSSSSSHSCGVQIGAAVCPHVTVWWSKGGVGTLRSRRGSTDWSLGAKAERGTAVVGRAPSTPRSCAVQPVVLRDQGGGSHPLVRSGKCPSILHGCLPYTYTEHTCIAVGANAPYSCIFETVHILLPKTRKHRKKRNETQTLVTVQRAVAGRCVLRPLRRSTRGGHGTRTESVTLIVRCR